ncbi:D-hexose-6-phosphate mutarotase [Variovorax terrae]|uniref:Putative glucose-6-phosphate 1-epimerase n=1 Tax=Variovorax terrae TaxID=2923278 RepID=A0A9X1VY20_9BURK|nr:D-hexose-6-phosphate mutarotase [Variovorax terrae]MCJ0765015.1 D-hexose-6-phosphate mutarotase [Variovorax terrae]
MPESGAAWRLEEFRGQPCVGLHLGEHDSVRVALHGAQVLSWVAHGAERLYLSPRAVFDGHGAIRGGVPVCFPQFNDRGPLPKHGFARNQRWALAAEPGGSAPDALRAVFRLQDSPASRALWPHAFTLELELLLHPGRLDLVLTVHNTGAQALAFTAALHTYLGVAQVAAAEVQGLDGAACWDALSGERSLQRGAIAFAGEFDRVYAAAAAPLRLAQPGIAPLEIAQSASWAQTVVWNPGALKNASLADMPADGYQHMVCIEAAQVESPIALAAGAQWQGWQRLSVPA